MILCITPIELHRRLGLQNLCHIQFNAQITLWWIGWLFTIPTSGFALVQYSKWASHWRKEPISFCRKCALLLHNTWHVRLFLLVFTGTGNVQISCKNKPDIHVDTGVISCIIHATCTLAKTCTFLLKTIYLPEVFS